MGLNLLGVFILLLPFSLLSLIKTRKLGFLYILSTDILFHTFLAIAALYWQFFDYRNIIIINLIVALGIIIYLFKNRKRTNFRFKLNFWPIIAILIIAFELFSVHYLYTGKINTIYGHKKVENFSQVYPYFSDEWAGVAFTKYSIEQNALPIVNPLIDSFNHPYFPNIFIAFFAFLAEIFLILNITPLLGFVPLSIISGTLICFLVYLFLKSAKISSFIAILAALSLPWIINAAKLPGIWYLFPFILGFIFLLISLMAINLKNKNLVLISALASILFYPPLIVLSVPLLIIEFFFKRQFSLKQALPAFFGIAIITALIFILQIDTYPKMLAMFKNSFIRDNYEGCIPTRFLWQVLPFFTLPFIAIGFVSIYRRKMTSLFILMIISLIYWIIYSFSQKFFIIDYARIAVAAAYLYIIAFGFGLETSLHYLATKWKFLNNKNLQKNIKIIIIAFFVLMAIFYTRRETWQNVRLIYKHEFGFFEAPIEAPANNYLNQDDLEIFSKFSGKRFISVPWKGLVIGAATGNYPLTNKASIITNNLLSYEEFRSSNCRNKKILAEIHEIDYAYAPRFSCPNFKEITNSPEGLYLYEFIK